MDDIKNKLISAIKRGNLKIKNLQTKSDTEREQKGFFRNLSKLASKRGSLIVCAVIDALLLMALIFIFQLPKILSSALGLVSTSDGGGFGFFGIIIWLIASMIIDIVVVARMQTAFGDYNKDQKGKAEWTTKEELIAQYLQVPEKGRFFEGSGGIPIAWNRTDNKIFIDNSAVNNLIIGMTRSGKGETFMFPTIDIYSRALEKASLIIADPKLELYKASYDTLVKRGYEVHLLNLSNPIKGMAFNPLQSISAAFISGDRPSAEMLTRSFATTLFAEDGKSAKDPFWSNTATSLLSAMILAHVVDLVDMERIYLSNLQEDWENRKKEYYLQQEDVKAEILGKCKKMTEDELIFSSIPIPEEIEFPVEVVTGEFTRRITLYSIIHTFTVLSSDTLDPKTKQTALDLYFDVRPSTNSEKISFQTAGTGGKETKANVYLNMISRLTVFMYENNAKMTSRSSVDLLKVGYGEKPLAIFYSTPDYDQSNHFIASVFIRQLYFILAKHAEEKAYNNRCDRKVIFLLDEFGNLPPIDNMANIVTVCLGRNIHFNLVVQGLSQLESLYGDAAETIIQNCGNKIYLLSSDEKANKMIVRLVGNHTVTNVNRSGEKFSLRKSYTEIYDEQPLIREAELTQLQEGENIICRTMTRKDINGKDIVQKPIFNRGDQRFKYRYTYLQDDFPSPNPTAKINSLPYEDNGNIDLKDYTFDIEAYFQFMLNAWNKAVMTSKITGDIDIPDPADREGLWNYCKRGFVKEFINDKKRSFKSTM